MERLVIDTNNYLHYHDTPWDTQVLGYKTNEIDEIVYSNEYQLNMLIEKFEGYCINQKYLFTNIRINPEDKILRKVLNQLGYFNAETSLLVERGTNSFNVDNSVRNLKFTLRDYNVNDLDELQSMANTIFNHGRFFEDPYISYEQAKLRNKNWSNDLLAKSNIYIGEINTTIFGFMALNVENNKAVLQLGGVKNSFTMYSYSFWYKIFLEIIDKYEVKRISGLVSASNIRILNLYSYFNFKISNTFFGYHKHRNLS
jgi:hypothetical protein